MKKLLTSKMLRKLLILSCLVVGLVFVVSSTDTQSVSAAPCCSECPGQSPVDTGTACAAQCGASSGSCYDDCVYYGNRCWRTCNIDCGGGGFDECQFDTQCPPGNFCINNHCS